MANYNLRERFKKVNLSEDCGTTLPAATMPGPLTLETVMETLQASIQGCKDDLSKQIDDKTSTIQTTLTKIETSLSTLSDQVTDLEGRVSANEDNMADVLQRLEKAEENLKNANEKLVDFEDRNRRNNIVLFNILEKTENPCATAFLERIIPQVLAPITFDDSPLVVERCHRLGKPVDNKPRPLIARILNFKHRDKILNRSREMKEVFLEKRRIYFHPDCSAETRRKKEAFKEVKKQLVEKNITDYRLYHPAKLRVVHDGAVKWFTSPAEAEDFIKSLD